MKPQGTFPVLWPYRREEIKKLTDLGCPRVVPWDFVEPHEEQALRNHDQTVQRLAERGGLGVAEMVGVVTGRGLGWVFRQHDEDQVEELLKLLTEWQERRKQLEDQTT